MLADLFYYFFPYQIFKSVIFRGGMGYLTTYFFVVITMPFLIRKFRDLGITSDFERSKTDTSQVAYSGATPILGGVVLIPSIIISVLLWAWLNPYIIVALLFLFFYSLIGLADDIVKIINKRKIAKGLARKESYNEKSDGISGKWRLALEFLVTCILLGTLIFFFGQLNGQLQVPMIPLKNWFPEMPIVLYFIFAVFIVVGGANAVNLTDGLDSLATIPMLTCLSFIAAAAYISGDFETSSRLKMVFLGNNVKEISIIAFIMMGTLIAFLKFNSPPASIYMGDTGSLGLGAAVCCLFVFVKAELFLPIVGGVFFLAACTAIIQRLWFQILLRVKDRSYAEKNRFFYRAPYHHHKQAVMTASKREIKSFYHEIIKKLALYKLPDIDKYLSSDEVNSKVIWHIHIKSIWFLVIALIIYFKVR